MFLARIHSFIPFEQLISNLGRKYARFLCPALENTLFQGLLSIQRNVIKQKGGKGSANL